jgi:hypothetical protein
MQFPPTAKALNKLFENNAKDYDPPLCGIGKTRWKLALAHNYQAVDPSYLPAFQLERNILRGQAAARSRIANRAIQQPGFLGQRATRRKYTTRRRPKPDLPYGLNYLPREYISPYTFSGNYGPEIPPYEVFPVNIRNPATPVRVPGYVYRPQVVRKRQT